MAGSTQSINARLLKPYVSSSVFAQHGERGSTDIVCREIRRHIASLDDSEIQADGLSHVPDKLPPSTTVALALSHVSHRGPAWGGLSRSASDPAQADRENHLVLVLEREDLIAVHSTDERVKEHLFRKQQRLELGGVGLLTRAALEEALLPGEIATFWMGKGPAGRGGRGPSSKTTYGQNLEDTIDPIGDQRHTLSGARGSVDETVVGPGQEGVIGVNLERSGFWLRRSNNLTQYMLVHDHILRRISEVVASGGGRERFVIFAKYVDDIDAVRYAYDLSFVAPSEQPGYRPSADEIDAYEWLENRIVAVEPSGDRSARLTVADDTGDIVLIVRPTKARRSGVEFDVRQVDGDRDAGKRFSRLFSLVHPRIYYQSDHTITEQGVTEQHFTDVPYGGWIFDRLPDVVISEEKPGDGSRQAILTQGGTETDQSLFGWVIKTRKSGWLYCDDGADELCDFIHFDPNSDELTIWHVKACKSGRRRRIAAVPYEEVCAQVVKNSPSLALPHLVAELEARERRKDFGPLWLDGTLTPDLTKMIEALREPRANLKVAVRVLQPHVTQDLLLSARSQGTEGLHAEHQRLRRLDHLLIATDDAVSRLGAHLEVVTALTTEPAAV